MTDQQPAPSAAARAGVAIAVTVALTVGLILYFGPLAYEWVKAVHVVAIIAWMAGMLYLPRLFIYHCEAPEGSQMSETFKVMERRLLKIIMGPAMMISWILGLWLAWQAGFFSSGWFHAKLAFAVGMTAMHVYLSRAVRKFAADDNQVSARAWRMLNEIPTLLMIGIVIFVIVKPF